MKFVHGIELSSIMAALVPFVHRMVYIYIMRSYDMKSMLAESMGAATGLQLGALGGAKIGRR